MATHSSSLFILYEVFLIIVFVLATISSCTTACFTSVFSFGDSLTDTGNIIHTSQPDSIPRSAFPPYGETYFHHPTGRCSDGRLVIDFIAEHLGLPFVPPYFGGSQKEFREVGVNFAVAGASALDAAFLRERGTVLSTNISLNVQLSLFKKLLLSLCSTPSECRKLLGGSLVLLGEIGGNDYIHSFSGGVSMDIIQELVPYVIDTIALATEELIKLGSRTIMVPGNYPIGCSPLFLTQFAGTSESKDYDPYTGCLNWLNNFIEYHNEQLLVELNQLKRRHPHVNIIYADYYNAAMRIYHSPDHFGFTGGAVKACCGGGGPYNFNQSAQCGISPLATSCDDPSLFLSWDGLHFTEAAYRMIFQSIIQGPFSFPRFGALCIMDGYDEQPQKAHGVKEQDRLIW